MAQPEHLGRKRSRSKCEDGVCDFMPLSKRINNLHLDRPNNGDTAGQCISFPGQPMLNGSHQLQNGVFDNGTHWSPDQLTRPNEGFVADQAHSSLASSPPHQPVSDGTNSAWMAEQVMAQYAPMLDQTDNPHYYESNKMLYELFIQRMQRISQP